MSAPKQLVGVRCASSSRGDAVGAVLGEYDDGWYVLASHVSSSDMFAASDLQYHHNRLVAEHGWHDIPYVWEGCMSAAEFTATYPVVGRRDDSVVERLL